MHSLDVELRWLVKQLHLEQLVAENWHQKQESVTIRTSKTYISCFAHFESQFVRMESKFGIQICWKAEQGKDTLL